MSEKTNVQNWVTPDPATVDLGDSLSSALKIMADRGIGAVLVTDGGNLAGVFTERDLVRVVADFKQGSTKRAVREFMTPNPVTAAPTDDYNIVYLKMKTYNIRHIPIVADGNLVGIVSIRDLIHFYQNKLESDFAEARQKIGELKKLINLSTEEMLESLFAEINKYKEMSLTDHLTGLYNKRYFTMRLEEEASRAKRYEQDLSIIFCDIDHFKNVNDNHGHHFGDHVLREIGRVLSGELGDLTVISRLRKSDIIARYGGEEFVIILPETTEDDAAVAAEKMRKSIEGQHFAVNDTKAQVTMSFGVAGLSEAVRNMDELVRSADAAMYHAKQTGRNRVVRYSSLVNP